MQALIGDSSPTQNRFVTLLAVIIPLVAHAEAPQRLLRKLRELPAADAHQAVAVDADSVYVITNRAVAKLKKADGEVIARWSDSPAKSLKHLNSGVVREGRLYCAHSTWPSKPPTNTLEVWDTATLQHRKTIPFEETQGAINWVDWKDGHWWVVFATYGSEVAKTRLVQYTVDWRAVGEWRFPPSVLNRFAPHSNSGGAWGPDGLLYVTGHDHGEVYALRVPRALQTAKAPAELEHVDTLPAPIAGQGIAWDRTDIGVMYGIRRHQKQVVASRLSHSAEYQPLELKIRWNRHSENPVIAPRAGKFDSRRCMNPWVVRRGADYDVYYSGGDETGRQRLGVATGKAENLTLWSRRGPLFESGAAGAFDARWCVLPHVVRISGEWRCYYTGNAGKGSGLSAFPGIGYASSTNGVDWKRSAMGPVLTPSGESGSGNAIGIAGGSVLKVRLPDGKEQWRFYYTGCPTMGKPLKLNQQKTICLAVSSDWEQWEDRGAIMYRDPQRDYEDVGVAGPVVQQRPNGDYRMWYSAIGTRWGFYSICYAESNDGIHWRRGKPGDNLQLTPQGHGWERQMVEYPSITRESRKLRLFYCGNGYGQTGIGTAVSAEDVPE